MFCVFSSHRIEETISGVEQFVRSVADYSLENNMKGTVICAPPLKEHNEPSHFLVRTIRKNALISMKCTIMIPPTRNPYLWLLESIIEG